MFGPYLYEIETLMDLCHPLEIAIVVALADLLANVIWVDPWYLREIATGVLPLLCPREIEIVVRLA
jgi:hypothetical protein